MQFLRQSFSKRVATHRFFRAFVGFAHNMGFSHHLALRLTCITLRRETMSNVLWLLHLLPSHISLFAPPPIPGNVVLALEEITASARAVATRKLKKTHVIQHCHEWGVGKGEIWRKTGWNGKNRGCCYYCENDCLTKALGIAPQVWQAKTVRPQQLKRLLTAIFSPATLQCQPPENDTKIWRRRPLPK